MLKRIFNSKKIRFATSYVGLFFIVAIALFIVFKDAKINDFLVSMENKTFDLRQTILVNSGYKKPNKDIVLVTVDDGSYEYILENYGEWPVPRNVYADFINYVEKQNPKAIAFDIMFVKSMNKNKAADEMLADAIKKYNNVFVAMSFDNQSFDLRKPQRLPDKLKINVTNNSNINFKDLYFTNCRTILQKIINVSSNIGMINVIRDNDGILRSEPPFLMYNGDFYPQLALLVGMKYLYGNTKNYTRNFLVTKNSNINLSNRSIPLDDAGKVILNWYGKAGETFYEIPFYKVLKAINGDPDAQKFDFKNKVVYFGVTAVGLYDIKSVPIDNVYPGVELHMTFLNNLIDNNFIKKVDKSVNIIISIILGIFIGAVVLRTTSTFVALGTTLLTTFGYVVASYYLMKFFNLWLAIVLPAIVILFAFVSAYIIKYLLKSRDFEYQYKLATTDGLTELYNHRYFQEQMIMQISTGKRYNTCFSLVLIDIDFFKKFNDSFGHQAGDAVLKQVAQKLKRNVRSTDFVCRYGGEEMSIILPNADKDEAIITAQKICQAVAEKPFKLGNDKESKVTISLGVSTFPQDGENVAELIEHADKGLYMAKENGRNQVGFAD